MTSHDRQFAIWIGCFVVLLAGLVFLLPLCLRSEAPPPLDAHHGNGGRG